MHKILAVVLMMGGALVMPDDIRAAEDLEKATFAGGCFWCMEPPFERLDGVTDVVAGYTGGRTENPTYEEVSTGTTGHLEAVQVTYNPARITYPELLAAFWQHIDPTDAAGQFADKGSQYQTAIFYHTEEQKRLAEESKKRLGASGAYEKPIATRILKAAPFYKAEGYHQDYYKKQAGPYKAYKEGSGRARYIEESSRKRLTPLQYEVTQQCGTEPAFGNEYWDNKREGIYVDVVSGEVLFSSRDKFESGTGWPSFTKPVEGRAIVEREDTSHLMKRTEVRSKRADAHLGHVFPDGPAPGGLRYCINSAALRFIPKEDLEEEGYGAYRYLFEK